MFSVKMYGMQYPILHIQTIPDIALTRSRSFQYPANVPAATALFFQRDQLEPKERVSRGLEPKEPRHGY